MSETQKHTKPNVPNLRFPGFEGEWKQHYLSEYLDFKNGLNPSAKSFGEGIKFISVMDILNNPFISYDCIRASVVATDKEKEEFCVEYGDILFQRSSETLEDVGHANVYLDNRPALFGGFTIRGKKKGGYNPLFFKHLLDSPTARKKVIVKGGGAQHFNIGQEGLSTVSLSFPSLPEQNKIADIFSLIDERITIQNKVIERYESLIKALRHHIFASINPVEEVRFTDILSYEQPTRYIVTDTEYSDDKNLTPVLTANKAFILGYTEEKEGIFKKGPCIILDDFTLDCKMVDFPFKVKSSAIKILTAKRSVNLRYVFEYLRYLDLNTEEHKRHYIAEIEPRTIELPGMAEIDAIANLFSKLDSRKQLAERDLELLKSEKAFFLNTLFI